MTAEHTHDHDHDHDHDHAHGHGHGAGHSHHHLPAPGQMNRAFVIGIVLNVLIVVGQVVFGLWTNSVALLADAGHNFSDVLGLVAAFAASLLATRAPTPRFTYGLKGTSILAALFNAVLLLVAMGALSWEALRRLATPEPIDGATVAIVAAICAVLNGVTAWLFSSGAKDLNVRGAFLHMLSDALVSVGVVVAGLLVLATGWLWLDPVVSLVINAVIIWGTWGLFRDSVSMTLNAVPPDIEPDDVRSFLAERPGVSELHDLHIWSMSTTEAALTAHLVMPDGHPGDQFLADLVDGVRTRFGIVHVTVQVERDGRDCPLASDHVV